MRILGMLLVAASAAFVALLVRDNIRGPVYTPTIIGHALPSLNVLAIFVSGVVLAVLFCLGIWMVAAGARRHRAASGGRHGPSQASATRAS
ncbi:hypothetical protein [Gandjariella thermophila]|uniref:Uncharacterized protein n=1 Tax=Gandjariella thermophila TaxID=1931992 RepID=A0A4D4J790_9PSEU|nr:hypothetical protein [Gandjariella thermophila]GDY32665.1 hypothetical protein GTS_42980 [Gandjariella thermophila]